MDSKKFEDTLMKLVGFAKSKVKYEDFSAVDKRNLIELFATNERTLLYIYRSLFHSDSE